MNMRWRLALGLMLASGFAGLGYQIVWTHQSALWLGHETAGVLAVVAAFFGGLAAGALALGRRIERSPRPGRWYAGCEAVIGLWSLVLAGLMAPVSGGLLRLTGPQPSAGWQWAVAFLGTFVLLLPATAAMGATLPAMERALSAWRRQGSAIAVLYAGNTLGAVLGVLASAFWLVPAYGLSRTALVCAVLNLLCAAAALRLFPAAAAAPAAPPATVPAPGVLPLLAATGLLGIGYEVLVVRVLSQVAENTVYTFAMLLAVYLVGTAAGAAFYQRRLVGRGGDAGLLRDRLLWALAAACLLGTASLWGAELLKAVAVQRLGAGMAAALAAEAVLAAAAFLLPTFVMGALFSHLAIQARAAGIGFGRALGVNTLGAAAAPLLFGVLLVPAFGPKAALLLVVGGYLALCSMRAWSTLPSWAALAAVLGLAVAAPPLAFVEVPEGGRIVSYREGAMAAVSVVEDAQGVSRLRINNRQQEGSSSTLLADARQALLPLLLHPAPRRALFLGLGTGMTASSAAQDRMLQVDAVELLPEVIEASAHFSQPFVDGGAASRLHLMAADARRFVRATDRRYDLIVSDNFHPARSGSGALYTVEHFEAVRGRLAPGGLFCQWLPLHQLDLPTLRSIVRAFTEVYPGGWALLATHSLDTPVLGLVARRDAARFDVAQVRDRLAHAALPHGPAEFGLPDEYALLGSFVAGPRALRQFAGHAPVNTDDHPVVAYRAPRITYAPDSLPRERLVALLHALSIEPSELTDDAGVARRLAAYWSARDLFIEVGRNVQPTADVHRMLAQVRVPLLAVLRTSPDFRPAYDPLLQMAGALARSDAPAAQALFTELAALQPARPEAREALRAMAGRPAPPLP
ncbi:fused MFS/spermidine synthase [Aquincola sp. MAHUQ-54]|uniref:Fused MFS/spermidine synthase n=1 Tax=Aquincola agrisoli TaxID=3119538 RepID=A0AAW9Q7Q3_9BURK